ncbi:hypothetical protein JCM11491_004801 [Sporobolomyces phaffii]
MPQPDQPVPPPPPRAARRDPASLREEYSISLREEAGEYEAANRNFDSAISSIEEAISSQRPLQDGLPSELADCATLEGRLAQLEAELADLADDALPPNDPMLGVSDLTAMEVACWQIEDTVVQLRAAEEREKARLVSEQDRLDEAQMLLEESKALNRALSAKARDGIPPASILAQRTQARMAHLQDQFRILQAGLVDYVDQLAISLSESGEASDKADTIQAEDLSLRAYFGRPPQDAKDTPQRRATDLKSLLEKLMNESLLGLASQRGPHEAFGNPVERDPSERQDEYLLRVLERIGMVEKCQDRWKLVVLTEI